MDMLLNELFLSERLMDIDADVAYIYNLGFRNPLAQIQQSGRIEHDTFTKHVIDTSKLTSDLARRAHALNPCAIHIQDPAIGGNHYDPRNRLISVQTNINAISYVRFNHGGDLQKAANSLDSPLDSRLLKEFSPAVARGSIHHELVHWIDDTLHNQHIHKRIQRAYQQNQTTLARNVPINLDHLELQSQIHNIYQLKQAHASDWDSMSFVDMISYSPSLSAIYDNLSPAHKTYWLRKLKTRMAREGLLGRNMK